MGTLARNGLNHDLCFEPQVDFGIYSIFDENKKPRRLLETVIS